MSHTNAFDHNCIFTCVAYSKYCASGRRPKKTIPPPRPKTQWRDRATTMATYNCPNGGWLVLTFISIAAGNASRLTSEHRLWSRRSCWHQRTRCGWGGTHHHLPPAAVLPEGGRAEGRGRQPPRRSKVKMFRGGFCNLPFEPKLRKQYSCMGADAQSAPAVALPPQLKPERPPPPDAAKTKH